MPGKIQCILWPLLFLKCTGKSRGKTQHVLLNQQDWRSAWGSSPRPRVEGAAWEPDGSVRDHLAGEWLESPVPPLWTRKQQRPIRAVTRTHVSTSPSTHLTLDTQETLREHTRRGQTSPPLPPPRLPRFPVRNHPAEVHPASGTSTAQSSPGTV